MQLLKYCNFRSRSSAPSDAECPRRQWRLDPLLLPDEFSYTNLPHIKTKHQMFLRSPERLFEGCDEYQHIS